MGYYSKRKILDRDGLVSPEVIPYLREGRHYELIADFNPTWVVILRDSPTSGFAGEERFLRSYSHEITFARDRFTYDVYRKRVGLPKES